MGNRFSSRGMVRSRTETPKVPPSRAYSQVTREPRLEPVDLEALRLVLELLLELWAESQRR